MRDIGIEMTVEHVNIGKIYAYLWKDKLCIGEAIKNPTQGAYEWAMKNIYTGKVEYPYYTDIVVPNSKYKNIAAQIRYYS